MRNVSALNDKLAYINVVFKMCTRLSVECMLFERCLTFSINNYTHFFIFLILHNRHKPQFFFVKIFSKYYHCSDITFWFVFLTSSYLPSLLSPENFKYLAFLLCVIDKSHSPYGPVLQYHSESLFSALIAGLDLTLILPCSVC